ncbi:MAG TPA: hypothetical protein VFO18_16950 [Methylomirabilota bacterium]|nr:hypothetical protein [Methylomirabilota bacterium]
MKRWLQRTTKEERNTIYAPAQDEEDEGGEDDFLTDKLIEIGDPYQRSETPISSSRSTTLWRWTTGRP